MSDAEILYCGDTTLAGAASYLAGVLSHAGLAFDYLASDEPIGPRLADASHRLYILSDYPVKNFADGEAAELVERVHKGAGLLMIGGWESFHGAAGEYQRSAIAEALPVTMLDRDDRVNCAQPCVIEKLADHALLGDLPWRRPPCVGGYNRVRQRATAQVLLAAYSYEAVFERGHFRFEPRDSSVLLAIGRHGRGRTAAFTSDVAPHWVGGLVDWGDGRVHARAPGGDAVEVGNHYATFFTRLVRWTMGEYAE